ncbi:MAG: hypothetical protein K0R00_3959 [Herbinix sp.]|jgi:hypothetical protein|nr:hypothetical protein [Herbinix sp.]
METNKKIIRKTFLPHQYEKEELYLSKMAKEGWVFVKFQAGLPTKYEFIQSEPIDYIYQLDYVKEKENTDSYHQLFADAGWEEVYASDGIYNGKWYYFRRLRNDDKHTAIFTDNESKIHLYTKLLKDYSLFYLFLFMIQYFGCSSFIRGIFREGLSAVDNVFFAIFTLTSLLINILYIAMIVGIYNKRMKLMKKKKL